LPLNGCFDGFDAADELTRNLRCASGPLAALSGRSTLAEAHSEVSGREMAVTVRMRLLARIVGRTNWKMAQMTGRVS